MATCRIQSIAPPCAYNVEGVQRILLLDSEDFEGFQFDGDDLYDNCLITAVFHSGDFIELPLSDSAKYTSNISGGVYTHTLESFIFSLSAEITRQLHLATKRNYLVFFQSKDGRYHVFGYDFFARITYANQTAEAIGSLITATAISIYPLFEVTADALNGQPHYGSEFVPDFDFNAYCITNG